MLTLGKLAAELNVQYKGDSTIELHGIRSLQKCAPAVWDDLYDNIREDDIGTVIINVARTFIEQNPAYSFVTARLLLDQLIREACEFLAVASHGQARSTLYTSIFCRSIEQGVQLGLLSPKLLDFNLQQLGAAIIPKRDDQFMYLGMQTLYDRYFLHSQKVRFELPQTFFMRVAMGLAINEDDKNDRAIEFYRLLSSFDFMSSTPTLFNAGTTHSQLSSCYLSTVADDLEGIYDSVRDNAVLSKWAGGLGNDWTPVRAVGSHIKGTNGKSQGVIPFLKVVNDTAVAVNQGGKRKGAVCAYLENWHLDIEEFIELRKNTGDDRRRTHDMNTAVWIPDLFMERVMADGNWTLFSPHDVKDLHELYGNAFRERYIHYEKCAENGELKLHKTISAKTLWRKTLSMLYESGHPWCTFKDVCNIRSPQQHAGVVHSSNLCTEITLITSENEIAVCNLGSINLANHITLEGKLDVAKIKKTTQTAVRMLDNVIDINFYALNKAKTSNMRHRPIGMGLMGFQDVLYKMHIAYDSAEAVELADRSMEMISYYALEASANLAVERGVYETYNGSLWSQGILPIDSLTQLAAHRPPEFLEIDTHTTLNWDTLREKIKRTGIRNSNVLAIAPTATIANIVGVTPSIEPTYQNLYVKSNLSGEFTVVNRYLVDALREHDLWDAVMINDLKYYEGSVQKIKRVPDAIKAQFKTAFEIDAAWLVHAGSRRQKWLDQSQSLNLYFASEDGNQLDQLYRLAWRCGLKTTYYLRSLGTGSTEKSSVDKGNLNAVPSQIDGAHATAQGNGASKICAIDDSECEACQ